MTSLLHKELGQLEKQLLTLTAVVEESVQQAIKALSGHNRELAQKVIDNDDHINRLEVDLEEECLKVLALHQPVANDLRMIVAVLKINNDLERIADQAANICERALAISESPKMICPLELDKMGEKVIDMLEKALDSLVNADLEMARNVLELDDEVDAIHSGNYKSFKDYVRHHPDSVDIVLSYLTVSRHLERVADLATNIAEDVIYLNQGTIVRHTIA
ncbi:MAG TPA: phosphate signaling complex protein PhoU [Desulfuromonadales bacterium]|jgi:phosphate transport system protein|nr:phosphate signaling complex protein PhoU [Desulfuromonadales bacterium]